LGQGRENSKEYLRQNPELMKEIEAAVRQQALSGNIGLPWTGKAEQEDEEEELE